MLGMIKVLSFLGMLSLVASCGSSNGGRYGYYDGDYHDHDYSYRGHRHHQYHGHKDGHKGGGKQEGHGHH